MDGHPPSGIDPDETYVALTTYRSSGAMVTTPVWFVGGPHQLRVITDAHAGKVRRIHADPRVAVAACDVRGRVTGPQVHGTAVVESGPDRLGTLRADIERKYGLAARALTRVRSALGREPTHVELRVTLAG